MKEWRSLDNGRHNLLELMYTDPTRWSLLFQTYVQLTMLRQHSKPAIKPVRIMERSLLRFVPIAVKVFRPSFLVESSVKLKKIIKNLRSKSRFIAQVLCPYFYSFLQCPLLLCGKSSRARSDDRSRVCCFVRVVQLPSHLPKPGLWN